MVINEDFFKTLTILYVENDNEARAEFCPTLEKLFKKVFIANDAETALSTYEEACINEEKIDVIISESSLPKMSGIELLKQIRKTNRNIPFIFFTENGDVDLLLTSLRQDVTAHFVKPVDFEQVLKKVEEVCIVKKNEDEIASYQSEVEEYLNIINKVAIVFIFDKDGNINYINEFLRELIRCEDEEIIGQNYTVIYHPEMAKDILSKQWKALQDGNKWQGKVKYITKDSSVFYTNSTIIPVVNKTSNKVEKYISVNFLTTKEENERREYKKKVLYNLQETKRVYRVAQQKIDELNRELDKYKGFEKVEAYLTNQKQQNQEQYQQLQKLENRLKSGKRRFEQLTFGVNDKINKISIMTTEMRDFEVKASKKIVKVAEEIKIREAYIKRIKEEIEEKAVKIKDLEDVVKHRTEQLVERKG